MTHLFAAYLFDWTLADLTSKLIAIGTRLFAIALIFTAIYLLVFHAGKWSKVITAIAVAIFVGVFFVPNAILSLSNSLVAFFAP